AVGRHGRRGQRSGRRGGAGASGAGLVHPLGCPPRPRQLGRRAPRRTRGCRRAQRDGDRRRPLHRDSERRRAAVAGEARMIRVFVAAPSAALRLALPSRLEGPGLVGVGDGPTGEAAPPDVDVLVLGDTERVLVSADALTVTGSRAVVVIADDERPARALRSSPLRGWALVTREASAAELQAATAAAAHGFTVVPPA